MTDDQLTLLKESIDMVLTIETTDGERFLAQVLFVFDEPPTPDAFVVKVAPDPAGNFRPLDKTGQSLLLSEIAGVYRTE